MLGVCSKLRSSVGYERGSEQPYFCFLTGLWHKTRLKPNLRLSLSPSPPLPPSLCAHALVPERGEREGGRENACRYVFVTNRLKKKTWTSLGRDLGIHLHIIRFPWGWWDPCADQGPPSLYRGQVDLNEVPKDISDCHCSLCLCPH